MWRGRGRGDGEPAGTEAFGVPYPPSWLSLHASCPVAGTGSGADENGSGRVCGNRCEDGREALLGGLY